MHYHVSPFLLYFRDTLIFVLFDVIIGLIGATLIFSVTGFMAKSMDASIDDLAYSGKTSQTPF